MANDTVFENYVPENFLFIQASTLEDIMNDQNSLAARTIEKITRAAGYGAPASSLYTIINGIGITGGKPGIPHNTDHRGYTFFTRPQLNLSYDNVITTRRLTSYADQRPDNMANAIRCMLMPQGFLKSSDPSRRTNIGIGMPKENDLIDIRSNIVDDENCFIPLLSNNLISFSGLPDLSADTYTSKEGITKEAVTWIDDRPYQRGPFDLTLEFANTHGNLLTHFFHCWYEYACRVSEGSMSPFPVNIVTNRIDYQTRIYRLVLDRTRRYVQHISATIGFPTAYPMGRIFDFNLNEQLNTSSHTVSIPFRCVGVEYDDPILIYEFNKLVVRFNPRMEANVKFAKRGKGIPAHRNGMPIPDPSQMVEVHEADKFLFNYKAYPFIAESNELLWFVPRATYDQVKSLFKL